jgi:hypothetical protein
VLLAVGMAFHTIAGTAKRAPRIFRVAGMEWLFRLYHDPIRLSRRYLMSNSVFLYRLLLEAVKSLTFRSIQTLYVGLQERRGLTRAGETRLASESELQHLAVAGGIFQKTDSALTGPVDSSVVAIFPIDALVVQADT